MERLRLLIKRKIKLLAILSVQSVGLTMPQSQHSDFTITISIALRCRYNREFHMMKIMYRSVVVD
jgi:hypothetical protein